jgi:hypothetical protein
MSSFLIEDSTGERGIVQVEQVIGSKRVHLPDNVETLQRMVRTLAIERANLTEAQPRCLRSI